MEVLLPPDDIYKDSERGPRLLKDDHFYAAISAVSVVFIYAIIYWLFKPSWRIHLPLEELPPAGFIYALLLPLIWIVSALWLFLYRYRFALYLAVGVTFILTFLATLSVVERTIGGPAHTYDLMARKKPQPLDAKTLLQPLANSGKKNLIIVAASGGGILAAGWTAQVLTGLHAAYPEFPKELRLISSVSGGSVGAAHYVNSLSEISKLDKTRRTAALREVANDTMRSSLASTAYGVAFPDFKRAIWPFWVDEEFDRARLIEADWRRIANCRKQAFNQPTAPRDFRRFCRDQSDSVQSAQVLLSDLHGQMENGEIPAVIFNATVMETGERVAITPISTLKSKWTGLTSENAEPAPPRHAYARTLSEYLAAEGEVTDPSKQDRGERKDVTCDRAIYQHGFDIDLWTAARLSATFSYVSPAARAACFDRSTAERHAANQNSNGRLHLIDGGYHDNYGVASALNWLTAALEGYGGELPVSRIALIEIRAKPDIPKSTARTEWSSAWLGPFWGLLSSWGYAQTSANDTAVDQFIRRIKEGLAHSKRAIDFQSFVFVPDGSGPLSWHLSTEQKKRLCDEWWSESNRSTRQKLLKFLGGNASESLAKSLNASSPPGATECTVFN
jgi:hypothetical protein